MKKRKVLLNILTIFTAFSIGTSVVVHHNVAPTRVEAAQHTDNFDLYTYSGNYYSSINFSASEGLNGQLRQALTTLIYPKGWYTYGSSGADHLSTQLQYADEDPTNSSNMIYLYTRDSVKKNAASSWNREHVWPQSLSNGCWGESKAGTDILHIRPTYNSTNSSRSNDKYCDVNKASPRTYNGMTFGYGSGTKFEPLDSVKGDVARIIMYVWTAYKDYYSNIPDITNVFESYDTLLKWHTQDKPDVLEGNRNNYSESSDQKNRNPFVDHPELGWKIFGNSASTSVKNACMQAYPAEGSTVIEPTGIELNKNQLSLTVGGTATLSGTISPAGATGTITWSSSNTSIATVNSNGLVTAIGEGTATITAKISNTIKDQCVVTVSAASSQTENLLEKFDFVSDLTEYEQYNESKMNAFIKDSSSLGEATNYVSHTNGRSTDSSLTDPLIGASGKVSDVTWSHYNLLKIGSTSKDCKMTLTFKSGVEIDKVVVKAAGWYGKTCKLGINGSDKVTIASAVSAATILNESDFLEYEYTLNATNVVSLETTLAVMITEMELYTSGSGQPPVEPTAKEEINGITTRSALSYNYDKEVASETVSDVLNRSTIGVTDTVYTDWSNKTGTSGAVYAGQSAGGNDSIQLRSKNSNSGIITTASGGKVSKVIVVWNSNTDSGRTIDIYGDTTAYTSPTELYNTPKGTKLGSIVKGTSTELTITGDYSYIGIRSNSGALYLDSIEIQWGGSATSFEFSRVAINFGGFINKTLWDKLNTESEIKGYGLIAAATDDLDGETIKGMYDEALDAGVTDIDAIINEEVCNGTTIRNFYTPLTQTKLHPAEADETQKYEQQVSETDTYYVWSLRKNVTDYDKPYSAIAYIRLADELVFFAETLTSAKEAAQSLINNGIYDGSEFEGSLGYFANL